MCQDRRLCGVSVYDAPFAVDFETEQSQPFQRNYGLPRPRQNQFAFLLESIPPQMNLWAKGSH